MSGGEGLLGRVGGVGRGSYAAAVAQRRFHYDKAFEHCLRANGVPYVAVDEAKRALRGGRQAAARGGGTGLKNFDFVVYRDGGANLLVDVKGRKHAGRTGRAMQNWVTRDDVKCLRQWAEVFGEGFAPAFVFLFWCEAQPPDALFLDVFRFGERWYAALAVGLDDYETHMRDRSAKWDTVSVPAADFDRIARPIGEFMGLTGGRMD